MDVKHQNPIDNTGEDAMAAIPAWVRKPPIGRAATREHPPEELTQASAARVGPDAIVSANQQQREPEQTAERRVDIGGAGGAGNQGRRSTGPRELNHARMSDGDILNF